MNQQQLVQSINNASRDQEAHILPSKPYDNDLVNFDQNDYTQLEGHPKDLMKAPTSYQNLTIFENPASEAKENVNSDSTKKQMINNIIANSSEAS